MFKPKSVIGKQNIRNDRFINEQIATEPLSPIKNTNKNYQHTFAKAKRTQTHHLDNNATIAQINPHKLYPQNMNLECDETLQISNNLPQWGQKAGDQMVDDLMCEEQLAPIIRNNSREFSDYAKRIQTLLFEYMRRDMLNTQYIQKLEEQRQFLLQNANRQDQALRLRGVYRK